MQKIMTQPIFTPFIRRNIKNSFQYIRKNEREYITLSRCCSIIRRKRWASEAQRRSSDFLKSASYNNILFYYDMGLDFKIMVLILHSPRISVYSTVKKSLDFTITSSLYPMLRKPHRHSIQASISLIIVYDLLPCLNFFLPVSEPEKCRVRICLYFRPVPITNSTF